jgi:pimeloyl-ACP methyl ester carboxylesterase
MTGATSAARARPAAIGVVRPFRVEVAQPRLDDLERRLDAFRETPFPFALPALGVDPGQLRRLVAHWRERFDWRRVEAQLNQHQHVLVEVDGMDVHAVHVRGEGPDPLPVIINHGWPSSFAEFLPIVDALTRPADHGGEAADAFDVVLPSLSGYVFSAPPVELADATAARMAARFHGVMSALGYERYGACGSDVGARVSAWMGAVAPDAVIGLHATSNAISPAPGTTEEERAWLALQDDWWEAEGAYGHIQRTKPRSLAMAMNDSPVGLAAWVLEKWTDWGDSGGDAIEHFGADHLLTTIALHWFAGSIGTSFLTYAAAELPPGPRPPAGAVTAPAGFYVARAEPHGYAPRSFAERQYRVVRWTTMPRGGHFMASEDPQRYVEEMRDFFRPLRRAASAT